MRTLKLAVMATLVVVLALLVTPTTSSAAPFTIGPVQGVQVDVNANGLLVNGFLATAGSWESTSALGVFEVYCVDLQHFLGGSNRTIESEFDQMSNWDIPGGQAGAGPKAAWLYNTYSQWAVGDNARRAALQLAIWESLFDVGNDVTSGGMYFTSPAVDSILTDANIMLTALTGANVAGSNSNWIRTQNVVGTDYTQDLMGGERQIPEPATIALLGLGLVVLARRRRH